MFIPAQKPTDAGEHLTDFTKPKTFCCIGYKPVSTNQKTEGALVFRRVSLTFLGIFLAGHGDHLSQREDQADGNPRAQRGAHVCTPDMQHPQTQQTRKSKRAPTPCYSIQTEKSKYPWVEQAPGWAITANWNKLTLYPPYTSLPPAPALLLFYSLIIFSCFISRPTSYSGSESCFERCR